MNPKTHHVEQSIARCRVILSLVVTATCYVDPHTGGAFSLDGYWATVLLTHLAYSLLLLRAQRASAPRHLTLIATVGDVLFSAAVATVTEGTTSPFYSFFAFAVLSVALRSGLRAALGVTSVTVALYVVLVLSLAPAEQHLYLMMRAAYIAITGYLVGYFGQERVKQEARIRKLEASFERERIARSLHDGYAQALAGVNLRLESCQELLRRGRESEALAELAELQLGVNREHDELRSYIRSLVDHEESGARAEDADATRVAIRADFTGSAGFVEHVLLMMLEGTRNVRRHAHARSASVDVRLAGGDLLLRIDDDGVGFDEGAGPPWSMRSRVAECRGSLTLPRDQRGGGHVLIQLPTA